MTTDDVRHVAALARLALADSEIAALTEELGRILDHIEKLSTCDTGGVPPTAHALALTAEAASGLRPDEPRPSLPLEAVLGNAPAAQRGFILMPRVVEGEP